MAFLPYVKVLIKSVHNDVSRNNLNNLSSAEGALAIFKFNSEINELAGVSVVLFFGFNLYQSTETLGCAIKHLGPFFKVVKILYLRYPWTLI
jgi:hypothetical protein